MSISASDVKKVRTITDAPMMVCKKALVECDGDIDKAVAHIQSNTAASAAKKADRQTYEGQIIVINENDYHALVEVNSETDFVSGGEHFKSFCTLLKQVALEHKPQTIEALLAAKTEEGDIEDARQALVAKVGENIKVSRFQTMQEGAFFYGYTHTNGKIASLVALGNEHMQVGKDIAMQAVATGPLVLNAGDLSDDHMAKIKESLEEGDDLDQHTKEAVLMDQDFIKDPDLTVKDYLDEAGAALVSFVRFEVGENVVREEVDFASEVYSQINGDS